MDLTDDITDPRLAKALAHPLRLEILRHLGDRTASPSEIATEIGAPLTNVSYHVRKLRALGLIKLVRKKPKRGVIEHYYSAKPRRQVSDEAWAETPAIVKEALVGPIAEGGVKEMVEAAHNGGFDRRDAHLSTTRMKLDDQGWKAIAKVLERAIDEVERLEGEARERLNEDPHGEALTATSILSLFESPAGGGASPDPAASPQRAQARRFRPQP